MERNPEIGRELTPAEIKPGTIVAIMPPDQDDMFTMHVVEVRHNLVVFYSGVLKWHVINIISGDQLKDDRNRQVRVFEYLGS